MAKWALGMRCARATTRAVEAAFAAGEILRTHMLRPDLALRRPRGHPLAAGS